MRDCDTSGRRIPYQSELADFCLNGRGKECRKTNASPFTQEEIGEFIGASRETVTRAFSLFTKQNFIAWNGPMLTITDRTALENFVTD